MDKLVGIAIFVTVLALWLGVWLLPVWLLVMASALLSAHDWREVKWSLRVAILPSLAIGLVAMRAHDPLVGEFVVPDLNNIAHTIAWTWVGGLGCAVIALLVGAGLRHLRLRSSKPRSGAT